MVAELESHSARCGERTRQTGNCRVAGKSHGSGSDEVVTGRTAGGCAGSGEVVILTVGTGRGHGAGSRTSSGGSGTWIGDFRLTTTVSRNWTLPIFAAVPWRITGRVQGAFDFVSDVR
jgi:hypothetical protein